jgi:mono/diheme cytochrome c family protein
MTITIRLAILAVLIGSAAVADFDGPAPTEFARARPATARDAGLAAFDEIYSVLTHPRCINCHTATEYPQQGDDRHRHLFGVLRGDDGRGVAALQCGSCHQQANADGAGVPGGPNWHLAPLSMAWQDTTDRPLPPAAICRQLTDSSRAHIPVKEMVHHHEVEPLVKWAYAPGLQPDGMPRAKPPLSHPQLVAATRRWVEAGAPCPDR